MFDINKKDPYYLEGPDISNGTICCLGEKIIFLDYYDGSLIYLFDSKKEECHQLKWQNKGYTCIEDLSQKNILGLKNNC